MRYKVDELKLLERKILGWGTLAALILLVIDALLLVKLQSMDGKVDALHPERFLASHARADSLLVLHDAKVESLLFDLRERLGVGDTSTEPPR